MKRIGIVLLTVLLLAGCSKAAKDKPAASTEAATQPVPTGVYEAGSEAEKQSGGAVRTYNISGIDLYAVNGGVAVHGASGELTLLDTEAGMVKNSATGLAHVLAVGENSVFYYDGSIRECALDGSPNGSWILPEQRMGDFAIGTHTREIYYCVSGQIRALHLDTGIDRMIKEHSLQKQSILAAYFGGEVLLWETEKGTGFISSVDGSEIAPRDGVKTMYTCGDAFMAYREDGIVEQVVVGQRGGDSSLLYVQGQELIPALALGGVVAVDGTDALHLSFYDIASGKKTAAVTIAGQVSCVGAAASDRYVWILTSTALYRWDISLSAVTEETVYTGAVPTAQQPDEAALAQCQQRVDQMEKDYGIKIEIWQDAVKYTGGNTMTVEYQPEAINTMLDALEPYLGLFPNKFLKTTIKNGWVRICLVRQLDNETGYARYWEDGDCYVAIDFDAPMEEAFFHCLGAAVDSHILGNSRDLEYWNDMNPEGFVYSYGAELPEGSDQYIPVYFADAMSMTYPTEDRARIFYYAMTQGNEQIFAEAVMQQKLLTLCQGIREAYDLQRSTETYPWEQYLTDSLAYVK